MNVANLQIEGLCMAIIAINHALVEKGVLTQIELNGALKKAEAIARSDERFVQDLNPSSRDAVCFPIRILEAANNEATPRSSTFSELARMVGETKGAVQRHVLSFHGSLRVD
jgi:hypothetical protein